MLDAAIGMALALIMGVVVAGCVPPVSVVYVPDPSAPMAGWKCPANRQFIAHTNPPCTWIPGGVLTQNCREQYIRNINEARGCVRETAPPAARDNSASVHPQADHGDDR